MNDKKYSDKHSTTGEVFTELIIETFRLNGALIVEGDRLTATLGLSSSRWQILGALWDGPQTVSQIARKMGLKRQSVQRTVNILFRDGFILFQDNPDHRRAKLAELTEDGYSVLTKANLRQIGWVNEVAKGIDLNELQSAVKTMQTLRTRLEEKKTQPSLIQKETP